MMNPTPTEIEEFRKEHKLTRRGLGERLGVTVSTIFKWEKGVRAPSTTAKLLLGRIEQELKKKKKRKEGKKDGKRNL